MLDLNGEKNNREENVALVVLDDVVSQEFRSTFDKIGSLFVNKSYPIYNSKTQEIEKLRHWKFNVVGSAPVFLGLTAQMITDLVGGP